MKTLKSYRAKFNALVLQEGKSEKTIRRYQSWIRRYLIFCKNCGLALKIASAQSFLRSYKQPSTRRQGYFALKFFFCKVIDIPNFLKLPECEPERRIRSLAWKKWWRKFGL